mmetsp:Transcript_29228/g.97023  ORF Transcript_29228/g.97023 Transcript_29228/m.97023 type:complete len:567 (-) Transcript_29228:800-2500(-)
MHAALRHAHLLRIGAVLAVHADTPTPLAPTTHRAQITDSALPEPPGIPPGAAIHASITVARIRLAGGARERLAAGLGRRRHADADRLSAGGVRGLVDEPAVANFELERVAPAEGVVWDILDSAALRDSPGKRFRTDELHVVVLVPSINGCGVEFDAQMLAPKWGLADRRWLEGVDDLELFEFLQLFLRPTEARPHRVPTIGGIVPHFQRDDGTHPHHLPDNNALHIHGHLELEFDELRPTGLKEVGCGVEVVAEEVVAPRIATAVAGHRRERDCLRDVPIGENIRRPGDLERVPRRKAVRQLVASRPKGGDREYFGGILLEGHDSIDLTVDFPVTDRHRHVVIFHEEDAVAGPLRDIPCHVLRVDVFERQHDRERLAHGTCHGEVGAGRRVVLRIEPEANRPDGRHPNAVRCLHFDHVRLDIVAVRDVQKTRERITLCVRLRNDRCEDRCIVVGQGVHLVQDAMLWKGRDDVGQSVPVRVLAVRKPLVAVWRVLHERLAYFCQLWHRVRGKVSGGHDPNWCRHECLRATGEHVGRAGFLDGGIRPEHPIVFGARCTQVEQLGTCPL